MHPVLIVVPVIAAAYGPRLWAERLMRKHDRVEDDFPAADALARRLLDEHGLQIVRVEATDVGDHYDPVAKAVRINRARFRRSSLTAITTAAHEVGHAIQDAAGYRPFRLHLHLVRIARVTGELGTVLLIGVPIAAAVAPGTLPPVVLAFAAAGMLTTAIAARMAALPSEWNASFARALPMLERCCIDRAEARDARLILIACSMTYLASVTAPVLTLWPWMRRVQPVGLVAGPIAVARHGGPSQEHRSMPGSRARFQARRLRRRSLAVVATRGCARGLIRCWLRATGDY